MYVCFPSKGCLDFFLICFSAWLSNQCRFSANFWITVYFYPNTKLCIKDAGTMLTTTTFLDWYYRKIWCQSGVKNKTLFSSAKYQWVLSSLKQAFQTLEAQISWGIFFFSTRIESRSKFKSPGIQTAPWLCWIWSDSTAGLNPKATSRAKLLWTQLELLIKTKLMNVAHCRVLQLAHLQFSQCLSNYCLNYSSTWLSMSPTVFQFLCRYSALPMCGTVTLFPAFPHTGRTLVSPADPEGIEPCSSSTICPSSHAQQKTNKTKWAFSILSYPTTLGGSVLIFKQSKVCNWVHLSSNRSQIIF